jgi:hypothetical protein
MYFIVNHIQVADSQFYGNLLPYILIYYTACVGKRFSHVGDNWNFEVCRIFTPTDGFIQ